MNDKELRLKVLSMLYQNDKEMKPAPGTIKDLEGLSLKEYHWASFYLIKHNLAEGHITKAGGVASAWASHVSGRGMDVIEKLIDTSIEQVEKNKISFSSKSSSYVQQFLELGIIWSKNPDLLNQAWEYFIHLIESRI